jgi:hypothetical protein
MANMKEAVGTAAKFIAELFPDADDIRLEEVAAEGSVWSVVLSFVPDGKNLLSVFDSPKRTFKTIEVERDSGEPLALRVWKA